MCLHSTPQPSSGVAKTLMQLASILSIAAETEQHGASVADLLVRQNGHDASLVMLQAKVSPSTFALREAFIQQQQEQQAAVDSLAVLPGCNRTADMQYEFVVGLHVPSAIKLSGKLAHKLCCALRIMSAGIGGLTAFIH